MFIQNDTGVGTNYSANPPTIPVLGAAQFPSTSGNPYASYYLISTIPASEGRNAVEIQNCSGAQIAVILDDGTAATGAAPNNASVFPLAGGASVGAQGGAWSSSTFKGRVQIYAPTTAASVYASED